MEVITIWVYANLAMTILFVVFFNKKPAAFWASSICWLIKGLKTAFGIVRAAIEFLSSALIRNTRNDIASAFWANSQRYGFSEGAFWES